jgi:hypothetical protein
MSDEGRSAKMPSRGATDYDAERDVILRKLAVLRDALHPRSDGHEFLASFEAIAMRCLDERRPKKAIQSIHSEMRVWIRDGLFDPQPKMQLLSKLAAIDETRNEEPA